MFLLPSKLQSSTLEEGPGCVKPDLNSLSIRVARLDAEVSIAARRSAAVESMVSSAEQWIDTRLAELTASLQAQMEARVETLVRQLFSQLPCGEQTISSQFSSGVIASCPCDALPDESMSSEFVKPCNSNTSGVEPMPRVRKLGGSSNKTGIQASLKGGQCPYDTPSDESVSSELFKPSDSNSNGGPAKPRLRRSGGSKHRPSKSRVRAENGMGGGAGNAVGPDSSCEDVRIYERMMQVPQETTENVPISEHSFRSSDLETKIQVRKRAAGKQRRQAAEEAQTQMATPSAPDPIIDDNPSEVRPAQQRRPSRQIDDDFLDVV